MKRCAYRFRAPAWPRTIATATCLSAALLVSTGVMAGRQTTDRVIIDIPQQWEVKHQFMGLSLFARPNQDSDPQGWSSDHIAVARQAFTGDRKTQTTAQLLDEMVKSKLAQIGHHTTDLSVLKQDALLVSKRPARQLELRYTEGLRTIHSVVVIIPTNASELTSVTMVTSPERVADRRPLFRKIVKDLVILQSP